MSGKTVMGWSVGQQVRCIRSDFRLFPDVSPSYREQLVSKHELPQAGTIYTIRGFNRNTRNWKINGTLGLYLVEIKNPLLRYQGGTLKELSFDVAGFEPVAVAEAA